MLSLTFAVAVAVLLLPLPRSVATRPDVPGASREQMLAAIAAQLRSGASLRHSLANVTDGHPEFRRVARLARAGAPLPEVIDALGGDERLRGAITVAAASGGRAAAVFQRLADRAGADNEEARQKSVLTAQARASAAVVAAMPVVWLVFGGVGRLRSLIDGGVAFVAVVGLVMETLGVLLIWRLAAR